jgi:GNAT superfamily N-acetyltransferase
MEIRAAVPADIPAIVHGYEWLFAAPGSEPPGWDPVAAAERLADAIGSEGAEVFVGADSGTIVGICTVYDDFDSVRFGRRAWVEDLAVHPDQRSQGVGKGLLDAAKDWARERGCSHLELDSAETRTDAHRFYEREGAAYRSYSFGWPL